MFSWKSSAIPRTPIPITFCWLRRAERSKTFTLQACPLLLPLTLANISNPYQTWPQENSSSSRSVKSSIYSPRKGILAQQASKKATKGFNQTTSLIFISETAPFSFCLGWSFNLFQSCAIDTLSPAVDNIWPALTSNVSFMTRFGEATLSKNRWLRTNIIFPPPSFSLRKWNKSAFYHFPCLHPCLCPHHREMFRFDSTPSNSWRI